VNISSCPYGNKILDDIVVGIDKFYVYVKNKYNWVSSKSFIYQLMHNRVALKEY